MNKTKIVDTHAYDILDHSSLWKNPSGVEKYRRSSDTSSTRVTNVCYPAFHASSTKRPRGNCTSHLKCLERDYVGNKVLYGDEHPYPYPLLKSAILN